MEEARIRLAAADDFPRWLPLWQGYQRFYRADIPLEFTQRTWARLLDPAEPMECAVAETGGDLVGMVHYVYHRSTWTAGDYCYLQDLFVQPDRRGAGCGRHLIQHVYDAARAHGASRVYWLTHETNTDAMKLYDKVAERSGFIQYRRSMA